VLDKRIARTHEISRDEDSNTYIFFFSKVRVLPTAFGNPYGIRSLIVYKDVDDCYIESTSVECHKLR
jgi:hypothetical protein